MDKLLLVAIAIMLASLMLGRIQVTSAAQVTVMPEIISIEGSNDEPAYQADNTLEPVRFCV